MNGKPATAPYAAAIFGGAVLWIGAAIASGKTEAWDSGLYWAVAYPLTILLAAILAYAFPVRPWRWALAAMLVQAVVLAVTAEGFGMLPIGLILFGILSLPAVAAAQLVGWLSRRKRLA